MKDFNLIIDEFSEIPKFQQLVDAVEEAVTDKSLLVGDKLPSVNYICKKHSLSRVTVFKALNILKDKGLICSVPNKGFYIAEERNRVFLFLDTFKAYKEVLYHSFKENLPDDVILDVHFHHYNIDLFEKVISENTGRYTKYIVMPFADDRVTSALSKLAVSDLLIIDWNVNSEKDNSVLYQDFKTPVYRCLEEAKTLLDKYKKFVFLYPEFTYHPYDSVSAFESFCKDNDIDYKVEKNSKDFFVEKGVAYFSVSDRMLSMFLEQCRENKFEPGVDTGIISYNETPMKKFIYKGVTVISTDFKLMGEKAAEFVKSGSMNYCVPTGLTVRESL